MRRSIHDSAKIAESTEVLTRHGKEARLTRRFRGPAVALGISLAVMLGGLLAATPAGAVTSMSSSQRVALIPGRGPVPADQGDGIMPTSQYVSGRSDESFSKFSFTSVPLNQITSSELSQFDTVALIQVSASSLSSTAKSALAGFVANGGKLIIHDADETAGNDYSWILPGSSFTQEGAGCTGNCGQVTGSAQILANSDLISSNPADSSYVYLAEMQRFTDAVGDANLLVSTDPRWFAVAEGTNAEGESGAAEAYASNNGLVIVNGFDTDDINPSPAPPWRCSGQYNVGNYMCSTAPGAPTPSVDWLAQMWYSELNQSWGVSSNNGLPETTPVSTIGTAVSAGQAGLPAVSACTANRKLSLRLKKLVHHHPKVVEIDVYVNGRRRLRERHGHWRNVTLAHLPKNRSFTVKIVAVTKRHYLLISKKKYAAC